MISKLIKVAASFVCVGSMYSTSTPVQAPVQKLRDQIRDVFYETLDSVHLVAPEDSPYLSASIQDALGFSKEDIENGGTSRERLEGIASAVMGLSIHQHKLSALVRKFERNRRRDMNSVVQLYNSIMSSLSGLESLVYASSITQLYYSSAVNIEFGALLSEINDRLPDIEEARLAAFEEKPLPYPPCPPHQGGTQGDADEEEESEEADVTPDEGSEPEGVEGGEGGEG
ncbi:MAG: hypothetical protein LBR89_02700 [Holosporales bacterium]|jgi:hypothetical protein|nr:hypothetical protein [Holosporales bacterium]